LSDQNPSRSTTYFQAGLLVAIATGSAVLSTVTSLQYVALGAVIASTASLAWLVVRQARDAVRHQTGSDALRRANIDLEGQVQAGVADARAFAERLRSVIDSAVDGIIVIDQHARIESFNPAAERLFGFPSSEALGRNVNMLMPSPHHEEHDGYISRYLTTGDPRIIGIGREVTGRRRDGSVFPVHLAVGQMMVDGEPKFTGILHDLSARVALEHRLRASEARWRSIIHSAVDGIVVIDANGRVEAFNPAAERLFGYSEAELMGQNVNMLMPSPYHEEHDGYLARYLATGQAKIIGTGREVTGRRRDGTTFPVHLSVGELTVEGKRMFTGILHDLTARIRLEEQLREGAALAKLGEMAAVIAHEVKNPLAGIRGAIQVIGGRLSTESRDAAVLSEIVKRIDALDGLIKDLLLFSRPPRPRRTAVDVGQLVTLTADLICQDPSLNHIRVDVEGSAPPVLGDPEMLKIVFQNLLVNSVHAMEGRGTIVVALSTTDSACQIAFTDTGPGIPQEVRDKIFTAFFTTKSRGSGLGLATAKRIVEAHQGQIHVECPPSGGTRVTVRLPMHATNALV
jgi:two-component system, LuxR family, sensor kinase FixL